MRVVLLNHSDSKGGASVATYRLYSSLRQQGVDARMLVMHKTLDDPNIDLLLPAWRRKAAFLYEHAYIFAHNGLSRRHLFKASVAVCGMEVHRHPWVQQADVVVLAWVNQGMLSLSEIEAIDKPLVWIMHDMWPFTAVCHHAQGCTHYHQHCGHCPLAFSGRFAHDMSWSTFSRKQRLFGNKTINMVAVSSWLLEKCKESPLMSGQPLHLIPNPFDINRMPSVASKSRKDYGLPEHSSLVIMGAARLDDPIKGLDIAVRALNDLHDSNVAAVFFGALRDPHALDALSIPYVHMGPVSDFDMLCDLYALSDVVLSTSHYESLGLTLIEGMAAGCVPVTFGTGGQTDIVDHLDTGYVAKYPDHRDVANGIRYALSGAIDKTRLRNAVIERFDTLHVTNRYIELFNNLVKK